MSLKRNIIANLLGRSYAMASVYLFVPFYVAILGIDRYGVVAFYAILLTVAGLADVGLSATLSREAAREPDRARLRDLLATMERALLGTAFVFAVIVFLSADLIARRWLNTDALGASETAASLRLMALMIAPQIGISLYTAGLLGLERQAGANVIQAAFVTIRGGLVIPLIHFQPSLMLFFGWQLGVTVIFFVVARVALLRGMGFSGLTSGRASLTVLRPVMGFAGGMFAITVLAAINTQMDKVLVSKIFSISEFGYYSLASTLAQLPAAVVAPLLVAMLPRVTRMVAAGDEDAASELFARFSRLVAALSGVGAVGLIAFAPEVLTLWLGADHVLPETVVVLRILALGGLFLAIGSTPFYFGLAYGHNRTSILIGFSTLVVAVPLLIVGSSRLGLTGAAWPWVLINLSSFVMLTAIVTRRYFRGSLTRLQLASTAYPILVCLVTMSIARWAASTIDAGPFFGCVIAAIAGLVALAISGWAEVRTVLLSRFPALRRS
jgi:O-antigen/teichoic acid export membrane protein